MARAKLLLPMADAPGEYAVLYDRTSGATQVFSGKGKRKSNVQFRKRYEILAQLYVSREAAGEAGSATDAAAATGEDKDGAEKDAAVGEDGGKAVEAAEKDNSVPLLLLGYEKTTGSGVLYAVTTDGHFQGLQKFVGWHNGWSSITALTDGTIVLHDRRSSKTEAHVLRQMSNDEMSRSLHSGASAGAAAASAPVRAYQLHAMWTIADESFDEILSMTSPGGASFILFLTRKGVDNQGRIESSRLTVLTSEGMDPSGTPRASRHKLPFSWESAVTDGSGLILFYDRASASCYSVRVSCELGQTMKVEHLSALQNVGQSWFAMRFWNGCRAVVGDDGDDNKARVVFYDRANGRADLYTIDRESGVLACVGEVPPALMTKRWDFVTTVAF